MPSHIRLPLASLSVAAVALCALPEVRAQDDDAFDRTPRSCVTTARIRNTDILDDRTILFYMRGNREVYRTYLPRDCPGLERADRFSYATQNGRLCDIDTITVLEEIGTSLRPTFTCRLGEFFPISREEAEELKLANEGEPLKRNAIRSEPVELPPGGKDTGDAAADADAAAGDAAPADATPSDATPGDAPVRDRRSRRERRDTGITSR